MAATKYPEELGVKVVSNGAKLVKKGEANTAAVFPLINGEWQELTNRLASLNAEIADLRNLREEVEAYRCGLSYSDRVKSAQTSIPELEAKIMQ